jgi:hypothetical protein
MALDKKTKVKEKKPEGRPTKYLNAYNGQVFKLCLLGATDKEIADFFEVSESTMNLWKIEYPEFSESIKEGKAKADYTIAESLFNRAKGSVVKKQQAFKVRKYNEAIDRLEDDVEVVDLEEQLPPDTTAIIFWLKNRKSREWRDKQEIEHSGNIITGIEMVIPDGSGKKDQA